MKDLGRHLLRSLVRSVLIASAVGLMYAWLLTTYPLSISR